jgi:hypothetical protein
MANRAFQPEPEPARHREGRGPVVVAIAGDIAALLLFASIGRSSHHEALGNVVKTIGVALPFLVGWGISAGLAGAFRRDALTDSRLALRRTVPAWLFGGIIGLVIRSLIEHRLVPLTFAGIALTFNLLVLTAWRTGLAAFLGRRSDLTTFGG